MTSLVMVDLIHLFFRANLIASSKEYVASLIGLYQNNGAVSCVRINFHFITDFPRAMGILR